MPAQPAMPQKNVKTFKLLIQDPSIANLYNKAKMSPGSRDAMQLANILDKQGVDWHTMPEFMEVLV